MRKKIVRIYEESSWCFIFSRQEKPCGKSVFYSSGKEFDFVLSWPMRTITDRIVLTVAHREGFWSVEQEGDYFGQSSEKEVAKAAATRRARDLQDGGRPCQIRVSGEHGFWMKAL
ncbi:hypothetical protein [Caulobacter segnis]